MGRLKINRPARPVRGRFTQIVENKAPHPNAQTPLMSFKHVMPKYCPSVCETAELRALTRKLCDWSRMTWQQIIQAPRQGMGLETIAESSLKQTPPRITPDQRVLAFRVHGIVRMLGCRDGQTLHVFAVDRAGEWYDHGS
jgi:hypothetical protein